MAGAGRYGSGTRKVARSCALTDADAGGEVVCTTFSPNGRLLAILIYDGTLRLWDPAAGKELRTWKVPTRTNTVYGVKYPYADYPPGFSADGESVFVAAEGILHRWDVRTGKELSAVAAPMGNDYKRALPVVDSRTVVVSGFQQGVTRLNLVNAASGQLIRTVGTSRTHRCHRAFSHRTEKRSRRLTVMDWCCGKWQVARNAAGSRKSAIQVAWRSRPMASCWRQVAMGVPKGCGCCKPLPAAKLAD